ncbi:MAG: carboxypeptidase regulatory-like domain-containing protein [Candidatus Electryonea clarkiae]|nr:carboxypeptidase regulatory-like domain-containing protein [Candidatus Electryonea clarkiae]MDP8285482.1 carboxypeptidase regulatory-like domain-containing protein [Candidatus Electryonea clarkiae]
MIAKFKFLIAASLASILCVSLCFSQITFTEHVVSDQFGGAHSAWAADIDSDGDIDILGTAQNDDDLTWWENDGAQNFEEHIISDNFDVARYAVTSDLDGDGDIDVLAAAWGAGDIAWFENDGDQDFTEHTIAGNFNGASAVYAADVDGDGDIDVLGSASNADDITWWENDGDQDFTEHTINGNYDCTRTVYAEDIDGDDDIDVLGTAQLATEITWWENDGDQPPDFTEYTLSDDFTGAAGIYAADLDSDGDMDILGGATGNNDICWFENDGGQPPEFTEHTVSDEYPGRYIHTGDIDLDGDLDVISINGPDDEVSWFENDGDQDFIEHTIANDFDDPYTVIAYDMDGDIDLDILAAAYSGNEITWWESDLDPVLDATCDGTVSNALTGDPVEGAAIRVGTRRDTTDVNGYYSTEALSGTRTVVITHEDYSRHTRVIELETGENRFDFEIVPLSPVSGTVTDVDTGDPIEDADICFGAEETTTNENGEWEISPQEQGEFAVYITAEHYYDYDETVDVEEGENTFDFEMIPLATISGTITDSETEEGVGDAEVTFGDTLYSAVSDDEGNYLIEDVQAGEYDVLIIVDGYFDYEDDEVEVEERENEINFEIDILSGDLTGIVSDALTQELLFGALVTVVDSETGETVREVETDEDGEYLAPALHDGVNFQVTVTMEGYATSETEEVLVRWDRDNEQDFELVPIFERGIAQLQTEQDLETWVSTTGIVTQGTNTTDTEHTDIYIQDDTNWGIQVWGDDPWDPENNINRGDEISVTGFLVEVDEMTRITNFELEIIDNDNPLPDPLIESTEDMSQLNQREGTWGQITGQINRDPPGEDDYSLIVNDGTGQCEVRIIENTGIDLSELSANDWGTFTGVIGLSRQGLRIIPNMQEDVERINIDPPRNLRLEYEIVPGDIQSLIVTLTWEHDHLDDWLRFKIYRDDEHVGNTQEMTWSETLIDPSPGEYQTYTFTYAVTAVYDEGESEYSNEVETIWDNTFVSERPYNGIPTEWALEAVYPNPFNPLLSVIIALPFKSDLNVRIYNLLGEQVAELASGHYPPGYKELAFDASELSSGIYFIYVNVPGKINEVRKVVLIR